MPMRTFARWLSCLLRSSGMGGGMAEILMMICGE
jgi:hypothetical protein